MTPTTVPVTQAGEPKLLPCPFCGGEAQLDIGKMVFEDAEVSCSSCGMTGPNFDEQLGSDHNRHCAIAAWNDRPRLASTQEPAGEAQRLRTALIEAGRAAGAHLADNVSNDFLMRIPEEVRLKMESLRTAASPFPREIEEALGHLKWLCDHAYNEGGCHELGYDPLETIRAALLERSGR